MNILFIITICHHHLSHAAFANHLSSKLHMHTQKGSREAEEGEGDDKDFYANSKFEGICEGVEEDGSSNKLFCDTLCKICVAEACECIAKHLGCAESYWEDEKNLQVSALGVRTAKGQEKNALPQFLRTSGDYCSTGGTSCDKGL